VSKLTIETNNDRERALFRRVFNTEDGRVALTAILDELYFYALDDTEPEAVFGRKLAGRLLGRMGIWTSDNRHRITESFLDIPWKDQEE